MSVEADPMVALVESWDTYLVEPPASSGARKPNYTNGKRSTTRCRRNSPLRECADAGASTLLLSSSRTFLSDARPPLSCLDEVADGSPLTSASAAAINTTTTTTTSTSDAAPSLLWLLTLVSRNVELLRAAAHLVLQFNAQFATLLEDNERDINELRERHQQQLASLLEVADSYTASDMIVDSTVTGRVVHQQEEELDRLERACAVAERRLECQLQETLYTFLHTSAPDAVAAANRREDTLSWVTAKTDVSTTLHSVGNSSMTTAATGATAGDGLYRAEVDVSRFAEVRKPAPRNPHQSNSAIAPFAPIRLVPVRTIRLNNEVGNASATSAANSPSRKRSNDVTLQPIILDVSPLSGLTRCLTCCTGTQPGAISSSVSSAAEEHLLRLAHTRHSVLLLIGSEAAAMEVIAACRAPELLLGAPHTCREAFRPLPHHPVLHVLFTTRLWGANVVLLWNPAQQPTPTTAAQAVVEDALELAYAWDADMFSVAVLEGARLPAATPQDGGRGQAATGSVTPPSPSVAGTAAARGESRERAASPTAALFAGQAMSMEVLRQLRNGVTRELLETAGNRRARCWQGSSAWLRLGGGSATTAGTHMCPRAVGVLYASQAAAAAAAAAAAVSTSTGPAAKASEGMSGASTAMTGSFVASASAAGSPLASSSSFAAASPSSASSPLYPNPASPVSAFRGPPVTFNTPLAIRAFLPLPEEYFIKDRPRGRAGGAAEGNLNSSVGRGGLGSSRGGSASRGQSGRGGRNSIINSNVNGAGAGSAAAAAVAATLTSDLEDSMNEDGDFSHGSFTASTLPRHVGNALNSVPGRAGASHDTANASLARERQRESMNLESLIHYAFGEFAEAL